MVHKIDLPIHVLRSLLNTGRATCTLQPDVKPNVKDVISHGGVYHDKYYARVDTVYENGSIELVYLGGGELSSIFH